MDYTDWFVGAVAFALGAIMSFMALRNDDRLFEVRKVRFFAGVWGRQPVRWLVVALGALLMVTGVVIALGFKVNWAQL